MHEPRFPTIGELFVGRYQIEKVIGTGGFAQVYRARQNDLGRDVAIKVLKPVTDTTKSDKERDQKFEQVSRRFAREAKLISRLKDRNTVVMYDYGSTPDGLLFMVLEYVDGITVSELLTSSGRLEPPRVVKILRQALASLHEAHAVGVLHRDIKPGNIMVYEHVGRADQVKVLDFGIAKTVDRVGDQASGNVSMSSDVTADGVLVGTPRYMSPEQIRGKKLGPGSDIYSLGLVAYELLIGAKAVNADSSLRIISRHLDTDPIALPYPLDLPPRLREIINRMLLKDPADRFQTCDEVLQALEHWDEVPPSIDAEDPTMTVDGSASQVRQFAAEKRKSSWLAAGIISLLVVIVGLLVLPGAMRGDDRAEPRLPAEEPQTEGVVNVDTVETPPTRPSGEEDSQQVARAPLGAAAEKAVESVEKATEAAAIVDAQPSEETETEVAEDTTDARNNEQPAQTATRKPKKKVRQERRTERRPATSDKVKSTFKPFAVE